MEKKTVFVAISNNIDKYVGTSCHDAYPEFIKEFGQDALDNKPFVNYFLYVDRAGKKTITIHENYGFFDSGDYETESTLDKMVDNYLNVGYPPKKTKIRFAKPYLIITDETSRKDVEQAFQRAGYYTFKEIKSNLPASSS